MPAEAARARLLTPAIKYWVCKSAPGFLYEAMECLGGNGYVEEGVLARLYREAPVNAIWEGSGNVMCLDVLRAFARDAEAARATLAELAREARDLPGAAEAAGLIGKTFADGAGGSQRPRRRRTAGAARGGRGAPGKGAGRWRRFLRARGCRAPRRDLMAPASLAARESAAAGKCRRIERRIAAAIAPHFAALTPSCSRFMRHIHPFGWSGTPASDAALSL